MTLFMGKNIHFALDVEYFFILVVLVIVMKVALAQGVTNYAIYSYIADKNRPFTIQL